MQIEKLMKTTLAASVVVFLSASVGVQSPVDSAPRSKEVMAAAFKAHRGDPDVFSLKKSWSFTRDWSSKSADGRKEYKGTNTYKDRKLYTDGRLSVGKKGGIVHKTTSTAYKTISNWEKDEHWESTNGIAWTKMRPSDVQNPDLPFIGSSKTFFETFELVAETPTIVKQDNEEYYKVEVKYKDSKNDRTRVYLISKSNNLFFEVHYIKREESLVEKYMDYAKVEGVMVPQKMTSVFSRKGIVLESDETTYSDFKFRNDVPDSLFVVPKK